MMMICFAMSVFNLGKVNLVPCKVCGRTFAQEVLNKHVPICQKNAKKKRKVFDSGKQRAQGSDVPYSATVKPGQAPKVGNLFLILNTATSTFCT